MRKLRRSESADAVRSTLFARRSSLSSRSSSASRPASSVVVPGQSAASPSAWLNQSRSVSGLTRSCSPTRRRVLSRVADHTTDRPPSDGAVLAEARRVLIDDPQPFDGWL